MDIAYVSQLRNIASLHLRGIGSADVVWVSRSIASSHLRNFGYPDFLKPSPQLRIFASLQLRLPRFPETLSVILVILVIPVNTFDFFDSQNRGEQMSQNKGEQMSQEQVYYNHFEAYLTKLVGTIRVTKKMTYLDYGDGPGRNYGETAVFTFCRKAENGPKIRFFPKNRNLLKD